LTQTSCFLKKNEYFVTIFYESNAYKTYLILVLVKILKNKRSYYCFKFIKIKNINFFSADLNIDVNEYNQSFLFSEYLKRVYHLG
jgi:hypothetical protein